MRIVARWERNEGVYHKVVVEMVTPVTLRTRRDAIFHRHGFGSRLGATHEDYQREQYGNGSHALTYAPRT